LSAWFESYRQLPNLRHYPILESLPYNIFIGLAVAVTALIAFWFKKKFSYWEDNGFEFIKPEFSFGSLKGVGYKIHFSEKTKVYYNDFRNKAKAVGLYFFTAPAILITDLDVVKHVLVKDFNNFHDRGLYVNTKSDPLSGHLFAIEDKL
jgi:cytochrome P450 family 6